MTFHTLNELIADGVRGRYVLVRSDLNVPLDGSTVTDDGRIKASLPVLAKLTDAGARVLVTAHLGRPKGAPEEKYSLKPAATRLAELAGFKVSLAADTVGESAKELAAALQDGEALVLENVRFDARETSKDDAERGAFADELVALTGDNGAFVDDAFGAVHRKHASVYDVATRLPSYQGDLVRTEVEVLRKLTTDTQRPYVVVLGGSKVSDKLAVIDNLLGKADTILVGGGMLFTFLAAAGHKVAGSLLEEDQIPVVQDYLKRAADAGTEFVVPTDVVVAAQVRRRRRARDRRGRRHRVEQLRSPGHRAGHRAGIGSGLRGTDQGRQDGVLERAHGRVRIRGLRRRHPGHRPGADRDGRVHGGWRRRLRGRGPDPRLRR